MNLKNNRLLLAAFIAAYFIVAWFFPWERFQLDSTISISYLWDLLFCAIAGILYKLPLKKSGLKGLVPRSVSILALAGLSILLIQMTAYPAPFKYLERPILQLLILAPIIEELVFRYAIFGAAEHSISSKKKVVFLTSILFSFSHLPGIWHLPETFKPFIIIQLGYTFVMGWVIGKARVRTGGITEPVALHLLFNLCFYFAVSRGWI